MLTNDGPVCYALSVRLCRAKLTARFDDRYAVANFSVRSSEKSQSKVIIIILIIILTDDNNNNKQICIAP